MASGWPDHTMPDLNADVDIAAQALAQLDIRIKNGVSTYSASAFTVAVDTNKTIISVTGQGIVHSSRLRVDHQNSALDSKPVLRIDGGVGINDTWSALDNDGAQLVTLFGPRIFEADLVLHKYGLEFPGGLSFESSFAIEYKNNDIATCAARAMAFYTLIS